MKKKAQVRHRIAPPLIRNLMEEVRIGAVSAREAAAYLELSRSRFYELYGAYLAVYKSGKHREWEPGVSGGDRTPKWPVAVTDLLRKQLSAAPPASYHFAAREVLRVCSYRLDRAQVRRWAAANNLAHAESIRSWQRRRLGKPWHHDAASHIGFPSSAADARYAR
jgi:hypothetical protein